MSAPRGDDLGDGARPGRTWGSPQRATRRAALIAAPALTAMVLVATGCSSGPTDGEASVCTTLQAMITKLEQGQRGEALDDFGRLREQTANSGNETMKREGAALFDTLSAPVADAGDLTIDDAQALGERALQTSSEHLGTLADECVEVDQPVELSPGALR